MSGKIKWTVKKEDKMQKYSTKKMLLIFSPSGKLDIISLKKLKYLLVQYLGPIKKKNLYRQ